MLERITKTYSKYTSKIYFLTKEKLPTKRILYFTYFSKGFISFHYMYVNTKIESKPLERQLRTDC